MLGTRLAQKLATCSSQKQRYFEAECLQETFTHELQALYTMEYETDRFVQVQALLLMGSSLDTPDEKKDALYWTGLAINIAYAIGLDQSPERQSIDPQQQRRCQILWWCLVIREHELALDLRRLPRISIVDCSVPLPTVEDFVLRKDSQRTFHQTNTSQIYWNNQRQQTMAAIFVHAVKLCFSVGRTLKLQLSPNHDRDDDMRRPASRGGMEYLERVSSCRARLYEWYEGLPMDLQLDSTTPTWLAPNEDKPLALQRLWLHMVHFATLSVLHTPKSHQGVLLPSPDSKWLDIYQQVVQLSSLKLADVTSILLREDLAQHLSSSAITLLYRASICHLQVLERHDERRSTHLQSFAHSVRALITLQGVYPSAERYITLIEAAARRSSSTEKEIKQERPDSNRVSTVSKLIADAVRLNLITPDSNPQESSAPSNTEEDVPFNNAPEFPVPNIFPHDLNDIDVAALLTPTSDSYGSVCETIEPQFLQLPEAHAMDSTDFQSYVNADDAFEGFANFDDNAFKMATLPNLEDENAFKIATVPGLEDENLFLGM